MSDGPVALTSTVGALDLTVTDSNPARFHLLIYAASGWQGGRTDPNYALAGTPILPDGGWKVSPLYVIAGIYTFVAIDFSSGELRVLAPFVPVS